LLLQNKAFAKGFLNQLSTSQMEELQKLIKDNIHSIGAASHGKSKSLEEELNKGNFLNVFMNLIPVDRAYLYWLNPQWAPT
jgi:hypothetical protein